MLNLIKRNKKYFENLDYNNVNLKQKNKIINSIKNNQILIIKGFYNTPKSNLISYIITNSNYKTEYLYSNKNLDLDNIIKNGNYIEFILLHLNKNIKIIILENFDSVPELNNFFNYIKINNIKIIIISNKVTSLSISYTKKEEITEIIIKENKKYNFVQISEENKKLEILKTNNIILEEIIRPYNLKSIDLYKYTLIYLSKLNNNSSIREINRKLNKNNKISLVTMIEYLKYSNEAKIIKQIKAFDIKKQKEIETKAKYYFTDTNFRNSLYNFELNNLLLKQNFLFSELDKRGYQINSGINGSYEFDFYVTKKTLTKPLSGILTPSQEQGAAKLDINTVCIDFCKSEDKKEIKKQINKLLKVPEKPQNTHENLTQTFSKYLILENSKEIGIKKLQYENLKIVKLEELLKII